jgi:hypothetical protein
MVTPSTRASPGFPRKSTKLSGSWEQARQSGFKPGPTRLRPSGERSEQKTGSIDERMAGRWQNPVV